RRCANNDDGLGLEPRPVKQIAGEKIGRTALHRLSNHPSAVECFRALRVATGDTLARAHWFPLATRADVRSAFCPSAPDLNGRGHAVEPMQSVNAASGAVAAPLAAAAALVIRPPRAGG